MLRFLFSLIMLAVLAYFATSVPLGKRTLWGHMVAIFRTEQAQDLVDGTKDEAKKLADRLRNGLGTDGGVPTKPTVEAGTAKPLDPLRHDEQKQMQKLVKERAH